MSRRAYRETNTSRVALPPLFALCLGTVVWSGAGCHRADSDEAAFPEQVEQRCQSRQGCHQLFAELSKKRDYCFQEYGNEERPEDCDRNDLHWWALKDHIELTELRAQRHADACEEQAQAVAQQKQQLEQQRRQWQQERERAARIDKTWQQLDPRKCAFEGDEDACYQLVRFIALGPSPHLEEAKSALASGQRLIEQRQGKKRYQPSGR